MSYFSPAPAPPTKLGRHRVFSKLAGIHVSPICLGGGNIGDQWHKIGAGAMTKETSFQLLDAFYEAGGNFIDTANNYQDETSEMFIGEWMEQRGIRDQIVLATKYSSPYKKHRQDIKQQTSYVGNNLKSMRISVDESLNKLRTSYIDIFYVHWWDWDTSIEEVMNGLHNLVVAGKVLYLGISDAPAWVVSRANTYARLTGKTPFVVYQGAWSILQRDLEREIIPMCREEGMAIAPWNVLAAGKIRTDEEEERRRQTGEKGRTMFGPNWERNETEKKVAKVLEGVASEVGASNIQAGESPVSQCSLSLLLIVFTLMCSQFAVAIAYVMQKVPYVFPIVGGRKVEHLKANIEALDVVLTDEHIKRLESAVPFDVGFPNNMFGDGTEYPAFGFRNVGTFDKWPRAQAIRPQPSQ
ncbi:aryl-alcohol dehydrogenase [Trametes cingulata]|nr:aryl-alcohol dehydrogenase [Trametes cingulata]